eukprot:TRINITY_DN245_c0_g1_i7.p1 TRINITY_DN245_c0_g1~~TRINITY_DN245_c0_g1_i7.p1  ORF type:complete len:199 (+),score=68.30 TRINITY_DN245_c0_g1_i7:641-1237(+)
MSELRDDIARFVRQVRLEVEQQEEREEEQMDECETDSESFSFQDLQPRQTHQELLRLIYKVEKEDHMWLQSLDDGCVCFQGAQCQCSPVQDCEEELEGGEEEELEGGEEEELEGGEEEELEEELECGEEEWFQAPADVSVCFVCFQEECRCLQPEDGEEERPRDPPPDDLLDYEDELALEAQARQLHHSPYTVGRFCG